MATTYGIEVKNRFELVLDDEDDPFEILKEQEEQAKKKDGDKTKKNAKNEKAKSAKTKQNKKAQIIEPEPAKPKQTEHVGGRREENPPPRRQREQSARNTDTDRPQSDRRPPRQNRGPRQDRQNDDFAPREQGFSSGGEFRDRDRPESGRGGRGTRRGGGFGRGRGRGGFGKREFDRHSGSDKTGVKPVDKRDGGGAFNWGTVKDDVDDQLNTTNLSEEITDWSATNEDTENQDPNESTDVAEEPAEPEEEEPKEMTLDEWKAMQTKQRVKSEFNLRRPGEGVDDAQWNKTYVLSKKPTEHEDSEEEEESDEEDRHGRKQHVVPIEITFSDNPRRGGGRRGVARGGGGRGRGEGGFGGRGRGEGGFGRGEGGFGRPESGGFGRGEGGFGRGGDRGGFGGRGREGGFGRGGRGGRGARDGFRGGPRGRKEAAPKFDDENDFPALTAKGS